MDRVSVMKSFVAVGRTDSFRAAAGSLGISGSMVSRHISELERQLGVQLVRRGTRMVTLTEQGQRYFEFSRRVLDELQREDLAIRGDQERVEGTLSVISPKWIGSLELSNAVAAFSRDHPEIGMIFDVGDMADNTYGFVEQGYGIAFHTRPHRDSSVRVRQIATLPFILCASREYMRQHEAPRQPMDLAVHGCLMHLYEPVWHLNRNGRVHRYKLPEASFTSNTYLVLTKAVQEGLGVALLPRHPVVEQLGDGRLEEVLPGYEVDNRPLYILYPPGLHSVKKFRLFIDYVSDWFDRLGAGLSGPVG